VVVATVTHADGLHLERLEIDRASWVAAPAPAAPYALAADATAPDLVDASAPRGYLPVRDLLPMGWSPVATVGDLGTFVGGATGGLDVIGRHLWQGGAAFATDGRALGSARYVYRRFARAQLFGQALSTWRIEQRIQTSDGDVLRLERKRSAAVGVSLPWQTFRRTTVISASLEIEERDHELRGDAAVIPSAEQITQLGPLVGGGLGLVFGNTQAGLRSISAQDGVRMSLFANYMTSRSDDRWRSGWEASASAYRSVPSWTTSGRPVLAATVRVAEERGPAASRLTAGGVGATAVIGEGGTNFEVRGYPSGLVAAHALWSARTEVRLPIARINRGLGAWPVYLRRFSGSLFADGVGAASRVDRLGAPTLLSAGAEVSSDIALFSGPPVHVRTGVGIPLRSLGSVSRGEARFYVTAGASF
jgi:hypothetical protein